MPTPRAVAVTALTGMALALVACGTPGDDRAQSTLTFRLWDEEAARAYTQSFEQFNQTHPQIDVQVEVVPWANYWDRLHQDVAQGTMADIYWTNTSTFGRMADRGDLLDLTAAVEPLREEWTEAVRDTYTRDGAHWGVPQVWDSVALFYNAELLEDADIDPTELRWDPTGAEDTLIDAALALTVDSEGHAADSPAFDPENIVQYGFNAEHDLQAVWLNFLAENGGQFQDESDRYVFASPEGAQALGYLVDLINTHHVAPPAAETNADGHYARDLFIQGDLALFQSGPYSLPHVTTASLDWGLAPKVEGPLGRVSVVHSVGAVADAGTQDPDAVVAVLDWLASGQGQQALATSGVGLPAAMDAQQAYVDYWAQHGVDAQVFLDAAEGRTVPAPRGPRANAGADEISLVFQEMFAGRIEVPEALQQAQDAANEAITP